MRLCRQDLGGAAGGGAVNPVEPGNRPEFLCAPGAAEDGSRFKVTDGSGAAEPHGGDDSDNQHQDAHSKNRTVIRSVRASDWGEGVAFGRSRVVSIPAGEKTRRAGPAAKRGEGIGRLSSLGACL